MKLHIVSTQVNSTEVLDSLVAALTVLKNNQGDEAATQAFTPTVMSVGKSFGLELDFTADFEHVLRDPQMTITKNFK